MSTARIVKPGTVVYSYNNVTISYVLDIATLKTPMSLVI